VPGDILSRFGQPPARDRICRESRKQRRRLNCRPYSTDDLLISRVQIVAAADDDVIIVGIVMDDAFTQARKQWCYKLFEIPGEFSDPFSKIGIGNQGLVFFNDL
jgi:hypothetical protein